jgi:hypothetical protein
MVMCEVEIGRGVSLAWWPHSALKFAGLRGAVISTFFNATYKMQVPNDY